MVCTFMTSVVCLVSWDGFWESVVGSNICDSSLLYLETWSWLDTLASLSPSSPIFRNILFNEIQLTNYFLFLLLILNMRCILAIWIFIFLILIFMELFGFSGFCRRKTVQDDSLHLLFIMLLRLIHANLFATMLPLFNLLKHFCLFVTFSFNMK